MPRFNLDPNAIKLDINKRRDSISYGSLYDIELTHKIYGSSVYVNGIVDKDAGILKALEMLEEKVYLHRLKNNHLNIMEHGTKNKK